MDKTISEAVIVDKLVLFGRSLSPDNPDYTSFTGNIEHDELLYDLEHFPHAFVVACIMNRQVKAERAWMVPFELKKRIGDFSFEALQKLSEEEIREHLNNPTPLHRFTEKMSLSLYSAFQIIKNNYKGTASLMWSDFPSSAEFIYRFLQIRGVGPKIANMAANILHRDFGIEFKDYSSIDISADVNVRRIFGRLRFTEGAPSVDSVIYKARALNPEFPARLDYPCWEIGKKWCRPQTPSCSKCVLKDVCPSNNAEFFQ